MPSTSESKGSEKPPDRSQLLEAVAAQQKISKAQSYAQSLREKAAKATNPQERERMIQEAYEKEIAVHGNSKFARRLQSGPWQGAAAGGGIGLGTGLGIGAAVGTLVGGIVSIPTTGLGALIGTGVGAVKGPFIKVGGKEKRWDEATPEEVVDALEKEQKRVDIPSDPASTTSSAERRKPRKLEIRSKTAENKAVTPDPEPTTGQEAPSRRPKELDSKSNSQLDVQSASRTNASGNADAADV